MHRAASALASALLARAAAHDRAAADHRPLAVVVLHPGGWPVAGTPLVEALCQLGPGPGRVLWLRSPWACGGPPGHPPEAPLAALTTCRLVWGLVNGDPAVPLALVAPGGGGGGGPGRDPGPSELWVVVGDLVPERVGWTGLAALAWLRLLCQHRPGPAAACVRVVLAVPTAPIALLLARYFGQHTASGTCAVVQAPGSGGSRGQVAVACLRAAASDLAAAAALTLEDLGTGLPSSRRACLLGDPAALTRDRPARHPRRTHRPWSLHTDPFHLAAHAFAGGPRPAPAAPQAVVSGAWTRAPVAWPLGLRAHPHPHPQPNPHPPPQARPGTRIPCGPVATGYLARSAAAGPCGQTVLYRLAPRVRVPCAVSAAGLLAATRDALALGWADSDLLDWRAWQRAVPPAAAARLAWCAPPPRDRQDRANALARSLWGAAAAEAGPPVGIAWLAGQVVRVAGAGGWLAGVAARVATVLAVAEPGPSCPTADRPAHRRHAVAATLAMLLAGPPSARARPPGAWALEAAPPACRSVHGDLVTLVQVFVNAVAQADPATPALRSLAASAAGGSEAHWVLRHGHPLTQLPWTDRTPAGPLVRHTLAGVPPLPALSAPLPPEARARMARWAQRWGLPHRSLARACRLWSRLVALAQSWPGDLLPQVPPPPHPPAQLPAQLARAWHAGFPDHLAIPVPPPAGSAAAASWRLCCDVRGAACPAPEALLGALPAQLDPCSVWAGQPPAALPQRCLFLCGQWTPPHLPTIAILSPLAPDDDPPG